MRNHLGLSLNISRFFKISFSDQCVHDSGMIHLIYVEFKKKKTVFDFM